MITVERVADIIHKYQTLTNAEQNPAKKQYMNMVLEAMKGDLEQIHKTGEPCPPELEPELEKHFALIDDWYNKSIN